MNLITEIIFIFVTYSFIGWILESLYKSILQKRIVNSGFLIGPFCPIYGYGALIMYYALESLKNNIIILFMVSFIILSIWEYIVGVLLELVFKAKYWDYSDKFCNINGRVCLLNSCFWGVLGCVFILVLNPFIYDVASKVPALYMIIFLVTSSTYIIVDTIITAVNIIKTNIRIGKFEEIEEEVRKRIKVIKYIRKRKERLVRKQFETQIDSFISKVSLKMSELERGKSDLKELIEKRTRRMRKAFPSMKSDRLSKIFERYDDKDIK